MTLWRWTEGLGFPQPDTVIQGRKFWRRETIEAWIAEQSGSKPKKSVRAETSVRRPTRIGDSQALAAKDVPCHVTAK
ncbi:MAG TPA: hypothetical protein VGL97_16960 [Bryobacteraceae bacterium]